MDRPLPQNRFRGIYLMIQRYLRHNVGSRALHWPSTCLFHPLSADDLHQRPAGLAGSERGGDPGGAGEILPLEILEFIGVYLTYVGENPSPQLLLFGLFFRCIFPCGNQRLMRLCARRTTWAALAGGGPPAQKAFLYTVLLIVAIAVTLTLMTVGNRFLGYAVENFRPPPFWQGCGPGLVPGGGHGGFLCPLFLYALAQDERQPWRNLWPGTPFPWRRGWRCLFATRCMWITFTNYSILYGSIGTAIVLLIWLYMSSVVLIMGAELNGTLISLRKDRIA